MPTKIFVDTNLLVYAVDESDPDRNQRARAFLEALANRAGGVVSTQVLQEFSSVSIRKLRLSPRTVLRMLATFDWLEVVQVDVSLLRTALELTMLEPLGFWDALMLAAAARANCAEVWTEDLSHGQTYRGVRAVNPFLA